MGAHACKVHHCTAFCASRYAGTDASSRVKIALGGLLPSNGVILRGEVERNIRTRVYD